MGSALSLESGATFLLSLEASMKVLAAGLVVLLVVVGETTAIGSGWRADAGIAIRQTIFSNLQLALRARSLVFLEPSMTTVRPAAFARLRSSITRSNGQAPLGGPRR